MSQGTPKSLAGVEGALTAAAVVMDGSTPASRGQGQSSPTKTWQHAAIGYTRNVPELSAGKMYVGNCYSRIKLKVGKRNPDGTVDEAFDGAGEVVEGLDSGLAAKAAAIIAGVRSEIGGQSEFMRSSGEKLFSVGEMYVLPVDTIAATCYEALSIEELQQNGNDPSTKAPRYKRMRGPGMDPTDVPASTAPIRVWRPDDVYQMLPTCSVRACLEVLEELVILTRLVRSSAISRLALSGILAIADEFDDDVDDTGVEDDSEAAHPLIVDIILNGAKAIDDPASASSWLPYLLTGPAALIEKGLKFIEFKSDDSVNVVKRREALERLAQGLDLPVEIILGHQQTTFANAAQISEDTFKVHIEPGVKMLCDAITLGILWPSLAVESGLTADQIAESGYPDEIMAFAVGYDASMLVSRPDMTQQILDLYLKDPTQGSVAITEVRKTVGLPGEGAPDIEEQTKRIDAVRLTKIRETIVAPPSDSAVALDQAGKAPVPGESAGQAQLETSGTKEGGRTSDTVEVIASAQRLALRIQAAGEVTLERCADRVGAKVRSKARSTVDLEAMAGVTNGDVARALGPHSVKRILGQEDPLIGEFKSFERVVATWATEAHVPDPWQLAKEVAGVLEHASSERLYGQRQPELDLDVLTALIAAGVAAPLTPDPVPV